MTAAPRVMSEWFLREYLAADAVVGPELHQVAVGRRRYFTGLLLGRDVQQEEAFGAKGCAVADVGVVSSCSSNLVDQLLVPYCKVRCFALLHVLAFFFWPILKGAGPICFQRIIIN